MKNPMTASEVARMVEAELGIAVAPRLISDLFYQRTLPEHLAPIIGGRRLISPEALPLIKEFIQKRGGLGSRSDADGR
jgi:hypothetical protein